MLRLRPTVLGAVLAAVTAATPGLALGAASDPSSNFYVNPSCSSAANCLQQAISYLDQARARLGQPAYQLPSSFAQLSSDEQLFVLANLDRGLYGLKPISGLTAQLDQAAAAGVGSDSDPVFAGPTTLAVASNWAGGYPNIAFAYGAWMYDDGPGGVNIDCASAGDPGCWGHRHNILWPFSGTDPLAMGAAAGTDPQGVPGFAMLLVQGPSNPDPSYVYPRSQAVAAGANAGTGAGHTRARPSSVTPSRRWIRIARLRVRGHTVFLRLVGAAGTRPACSLVRARSRRDRYRRCGSAVTYLRLRHGNYRLEVRAGGIVLTRYLRVA